MNYRNTSALVAAMAVASLFTSASNAHAATPTTSGVRASYNGRTLDLSRSWEDARACNVTAGGVTCYASEAAMDAAIARMSTGRLTPSVATGTCSTSLRLYDGTSYTGLVANVYATGSPYALSTLGFANRTSSYRVGACSATFKSGNGSTYPGGTSANASSPSMLAGWDNTITTVSM